ncbi:hypothetical protein Y032_0050g1955 [Ancylostoma ceylanicum]|uniref:Uncharacterized protein n=1 Tax=Ancylostoma ceylanicum TaxID=53326 RepID=A0A016U9J9_9BILA|nr:hypothetical protein Y032_0050g1955 [Ancylostoma ceylanicum]
MLDFFILLEYGWSHRFWIIDRMWKFALNYHRPAARAALSADSARLNFLQTDFIDCRVFVEAFANFLEDRIKQHNY